MRTSRIDRPRFFDRMDGFEFEEYCAKLLEKNGYKNVQVTSKSGDQGIDIIAYRHQLSYGIQCKNHTHNITNKAVQEAYTGCCYYNLDIPVVLTNRYFTQSAQNLATETEVLLWNREELLRLKKHTVCNGIFSGLLLCILLIGGLFTVLFLLK